MANPIGQQPAPAPAQPPEEKGYVVTVIYAIRDIVREIFEFICSCFQRPTPPPPPGPAAPAPLTEQQRLVQRLRNIPTGGEIMNLFNQHFNEEERTQIYLQLGRSAPRTAEWYTTYGENAIRGYNLKLGCQMVERDPITHLKDRLITKLENL
jgi:hypothetical protein